jgi:hypothetical protein
MLETNRAKSGVCAFVHSRTGVAHEDTFEVFPSRLVLALAVHNGLRWARSSMLFQLGAATQLSDATTFQILF